MLLDPAAEVRVVAELGQPLRPLVVEVARDRVVGAVLASPTYQRSEPPWSPGSARRRSGTGRGGAQSVDRGAREVAEVLVVDRVELAVVDEVAHVGVLDR